MTEEDMIDLLRSYDAMRDLKRALGLDRMSFTYDCLLERLNVGGVICRHARGFDGNVPQWMLEVLDDRESSYEERARKLMEGTG